MLPVEGQMLPDLTSDMQTDYTQLGIKPASTMLIHWCSRKDFNQQFMLNQSLVSDGYGISEAVGSPKEDLPYCQTMALRPLAHVLF